jgi:hypothetical protein
MGPRNPGFQVHVGEHLRLLGDSTAHTKIYDNFCHIATGSMPFFSILLGKLAALMLLGLGETPAMTNHRIRMHLFNLILIAAFFASLAGC